MLTIEGRGETAGALPLDLAAARAYFADVPAFLRKIELVDAIRPLARPGAYLITHHPVGGLGHHVVLVACLEASWEGDTMRLRPLDFDREKVQAAHPAVKGFIQGDLRLAAAPDGGTAAAFGFGVTVELPMPGALQLLPRPLVRATADGIMALRCEMVVRSLFRKVLEDFADAPLVAAP